MSKLGAKLVIFLVWTCVLSLIGLASISLLSWLGFVSYKFDALSHFRLHYAFFSGLLLVMAATLNARKSVILAGLLVASNLAGALIYPYKPISSETPKNNTVTVKIMSINTRNYVNNIDGIVRQIMRESPDIVMMQEVPDWKSPILYRLREAYPWQTDCVHLHRCRVAMLSKHPWKRAFAQLYGSHHTAIGVAEFGAALGNARIMTVHLHRPLFSDQLAQFTELKPFLFNSDGPVVVGGDFNAAPWSWMLRATVKSTGLLPLGGLNPTWPAHGFDSYRLGGKCLICFAQIQIDHFLGSRDVEVKSTRAGASVGSDHLPLIAEIMLPAGFTSAHLFTDRH